MQSNEDASRPLFHGTSSDDVDAICSDGFDRGFAGKNGQYFLCSQIVLVSIKNARFTAQIASGEDRPLLELYTWV